MGVSRGKRPDGTPASRSSVLSDVRNKNNQESLKLQKRIDEFNKEKILLVKGMDFEKLDLCDFLKHLKNCDSDKLSEFKQLQDEIRLTQKSGTPIPQDLARALVDTLSNITGGKPISLPQVPSRASKSPTKSLHIESELDRLPDLSSKTKEKTLSFLMRKPAGGQVGTKQAWKSDGTRQDDSAKPKVKESTSYVMVGAGAKSKNNAKPKSIVAQKKRRSGCVATFKREKTITFEEEIISSPKTSAWKMNDPELIEPELNQPSREFFTSTPNPLTRESTFASLDRSTNQNEGNTENKHRYSPDKRSSKKKKELNRKESVLESNALLSKTASIFAQQAKFYATTATEEEESLDLGLPKRRSPSAVPPLDIQTIHEDKELKSTEKSPKPRTPQNSSARIARIRRRSTFYDKVVEFNRDKPVFQRQESIAHTSRSQTEGEAAEEGAGNQSSRGPSASVAATSGQGSRANRRTAPIATPKSAKVKVTMPMLLSLGMGALQDPRKQHLYSSIQYAPGTMYARARTSDNIHFSRPSTMPGRRGGDGRSNKMRHSTRYAPEDEDDDDSTFSDSNYYDSDDSYDMRLLDHRKKRKRMHRRPLPERMQYLFDDIDYFVKPKKKPAIPLLLF